MVGQQVVGIQGLDQLTAKIRALGLNVSGELSASGMKGALVLEGAMKEKAQVRSGELRDSINSEETTEGDARVIKIGTNKKYAVFIEFGTGVYAEDGNGRQGGWFYVDEDGEGHWTMGSHPYPFVRPAVDEQGGRAAEVIRDGLESAIRTVIAL